MTRPATVANWRGHFARTQNYYEQGEQFFSKVKNVMYKALGLDLTTPLDRLPEEFTRVMASTQRGEKG